MVGVAPRNISQGTGSLLHGFSLGHDSSRPCHRCADGRFRSAGSRLNRLDIFRGETPARRRSLITGPARARSGHHRGTVRGTVAARLACVIGGVMAIVTPRTPKSGFEKRLGNAFG